MFTDNISFGNWLIFLCCTPCQTQKINPLIINKDFQMLNCLWQRDSLEILFGNIHWNKRTLSVFQFMENEKFWSSLRKGCVPSVARDSMPSPRHVAAPCFSTVPRHPVLCTPLLLCASSRFHATVLRHVLLHVVSLLHATSLSYPVPPTPITRHIAASCPALDLRSVLLWPLVVHILFYCTTAHCVIATCSVITYFELQLHCLYRPHNPV